MASSVVKGAAPYGVESIMIHSASVGALGTAGALWAALVVSPWQVWAQGPGAATNAFNEKTIQQWTLKGPLGETPKHARPDLPLSDQSNRGGWQKCEPMWDEFEGTALDTNKWTIGMSWWRGRQPAWFNPTNVTVRDGRLHLTMRKEAEPPELEKQG